MRLDRDATLALEIHRVEDLRFHLARLQRAGQFEETVRERRLAVVDVRDDGEIANELGIHDRMTSILTGNRSDFQAYRVEPRSPRDAG